MRLYQLLLTQYVPDVEDPFSPFRFPLFKKDLFEGRPDDFMKRLATLLTDLPYEDHCESAYRAITFLLSVLSGAHAIAEHHGYKGRSDIEVLTTRFVYVFEFKYNRTVREAMDHINSRDYAGRYALDPRPVLLIAANFTNDKRNRGLHYEILPLGK